MISAFAFSQKIDYGLYLLTTLARSEAGKPVSLREVADKNFMSFFFLQKVALELRRAGFITADRGKMGGYVLAKEPTQLNLKDIIETLEGKIALTPCMNNGATGNCKREGSCTMRYGLATVNSLIVQTFQQTTLQQLISPNH